MTTASAPIRLTPLVVFALLATALVLVEHRVAGNPTWMRHPALPAAVVCDLLLVLPALFYFAIIRPYRLPLRTLAGAFGGGLALSHWLLPAVSLSLLAWAGRVGVVLEVLAVGYTALRLRRIILNYRAARAQSADFIENIDAACRPVLGRFTEIVVTEAVMWRYALLPGSSRPEVGADAQAFSTYQNSGFTALLAVAGLLGVVEAGAAHLVVGHWYPAAAWVLTALSVYSLVLLLAHGQAVRRRPVILSAQGLAVRVGLGWRVLLPRAQVLSAQKISEAPAAAPDLLNTAALLLTPPNLLLALAAPQLVRGPYGLRRRVSRLAIYVDEPAALQRALATGH